jgi:hypothetical protein
MDTAAVNEISLQFRLAFEAIRQARADKACAYSMAQVTLLTVFLTQAGHGELDPDFLDDIEHQVSAVLENGRDSGEWQFPSPLIESLNIVVNEHDRQLRETRLQAIIEASQRLDHFIRRSPAKQRLAGTEP